MRIVFMGTPEFSVPTLELLSRSAHEVVEVVTRTDAPSGRGRRTTPPEVKVAAERLGLPLTQADSLNDPAFVKHVAGLEPDLIVVVAFRILPREILAIPRIGCINLHASLLPKYRGAAPINRAIINGERETGVTVFLLEPTVDTGRIIRQRRVPIGDDETFGELYATLEDIGAREVISAVDALSDGTAKAIAQDDTEATSAPKLTKDDARIDWTASAERVRNLVRGTNPAPGAWTTLGGEVFRVHRVDRSDDTFAGAPGEVVVADAKRGVAVVAGRGAVWLTTVQPPGKRSMPGDAWLRGVRIRTGVRFE